MIVNDVSDLIVGNAFLGMSGFLPRGMLHLKLEGLNPSGSIKAKTARALIRAAEESGELGPGSSIVESSSGNLGVALASIGSARGYPVTIVTDPNAAAHNVQLMRALGAKVIVVDTRDTSGGFLGTRIDYVQSLLDAHSSMVWLNQYSSPANVAVHRDWTSREILDEFGAPDWLFVGAGTTGTLMGCIDGLRATRNGAGTRIVGVDAAGSVTFGGPSARRLIPGLGTSRRPPIYREDAEFERIIIEEPDTIKTCRRVARDHGVLVGGSTGTVLAAVTALADRFDANSSILAISPDFGERYLNTVYSDQWVSTHYEPESMDDHRINNAKEQLLHV